MNNTKIIENIIQSVKITDKRKILLNGSGVSNEAPGDNIKQPGNKILFEQLTGIIYSFFYTSGAVNRNISGPAAEEILRSVKKLSKTNHSEEIFDEGWQVEYVNNDGSVTARKGAWLRQVLPGEFIAEKPVHGRPAPMDRIKIFCRKEQTASGDVFYYAYGNAIADDDRQSLVRIYFNNSFEGNCRLIYLFTTGLNDLQIPFTFKCLIHPAFYPRCDGAVLYFDKRYSAPVFYFLEHHYPLFAKELKKQTPLFAKKLAAGLAFAEDPVKTNESFGTHCCKMIAAAMIKAFENKSAEDKWMDEVRNHILNNHGYRDLDTLYLNPGSAYPYRFPQFANENK